MIKICYSSVIPGAVASAPSRTREEFRFLALLNMPLDKFFELLHGVKLMNFLFLSQLVIDEAKLSVSCELEIRLHFTKLNYLFFFRCDVLRGCTTPFQA
jgi:hypothetical protein